MTTASRIISRPPGRRFVTVRGVVLVGDLYRDALPAKVIIIVMNAGGPGRPMMSLALDDAAWALGGTQIIPLTGSVRR